MQHAIKPQQHLNVNITEKAVTHTEEYAWTEITISL